MRPRKVLSFEVLEQRTLLAAMTDGPLVGAVNDFSAKVFLRTDAKSLVAVEFSTDPTLLNSISSVPLKTVRSSDFTAIVPLTGLSPETTYYYRTLVGGIPQQQFNYPSFRTLA